MVSVTDLFWATVVCSEATEGRTVRDNRGIADRIMDILDVVFCCLLRSSNGISRGAGKIIVTGLDFKERVGTT